MLRYLTSSLIKFSFYLRALISGLGCLHHVIKSLHEKRGVENPVSLSLYPDDALEVEHRFNEHFMKLTSY